MEQQQQAMQASAQSVVPEHLEIGNQQFDGNLKGFRAYLESTKSGDPKLYASLDPDLARLEARQTTSIAMLGGGLFVGVASMLFAVLGRDDCGSPSLSSPSFASDVQAWGACNDANASRATAFL